MIPANPDIRLLENFSNTPGLVQMGISGTAGGCCYIKFNQEQALSTQPVHTGAEERGFIKIFER